MASKVNKQKGISPGGKAAILLAVFGVPALFALSSYGLSKLFDVAPYALVGVLVIFATVYTAQTVSLMYEFYELNAPILRFIPCLCETCLIDIKYHAACYILYAAALVCFGVSQLPYSIMGILGSDLATSAPFYLLVATFILLGAVQLIKGIGLRSCIKDISEDWYKQTHSEIGAVAKLSFLGFIPFVRVIALYSLNKPLSTMVSFMGVSVVDADDNDEFLEESD